MIVSLGLAGVLDLAAGLFFVYMLGEYLSYPLSWWQYAIGAFLGASPDIDLLLGFFGKDPDYHHEHLTHRPILGIPFAIAIGWFIGGTFWALAAGVGVFWHYLHDTKGFLLLYDNGIGWFWPFSRKYWGVQNLRVVGEDLKEFIQKEETGFNTIYACYLGPTQRALTELIPTGLLLGYVVGNLFAHSLGALVAALFYMSIIALWDACRHIMFAKN